MDARTHGGDHVKRKFLPIAAMASMLVSVASAQEAPVRAEIVARLPQSVGNIAITPDNQIIFSHHPFFSPDVRVAKLTSSTTFQPFPNADWNTPRNGTDHYLDNRLDHRHGIPHQDHTQAGRMEYAHRQARAHLLHARTDHARWIAAAGYRHRPEEPEVLYRRRGHRPGWRWLPCRDHHHRHGYGTRPACS